MQNFLSSEHKSLQNMIGKLSEKGQRDLFRPMFEDFIDSRHELVLLAHIIKIKGHFMPTGQRIKIFLTGVKPNWP